MDQSWLTLLLLALAAGFAPILFGFETFLLGEDHGLKRGMSFFTGIVLFRLFFFVVLGVVFPGLISQLSDLGQDSSGGMSNLMQQFIRNATSGQHVVLDLLLIVAGIFLFIQAIHHIRHRSGVAKETQPDAASKDQGKGAFGLLMLGFSWMAVSVNQWIFMSAALAQIFSLTQDSQTRIVLSLLFIFIASLMLVVPILFYIVRPQTAPKDLARLSNRIHEAAPYVVIIILFGLGFYFLAAGGIGLIQHLQGQ